MQTATVGRIGVESNLQQRKTNQNEAMTGCVFYSMPGRTPSKNCRPPCNALCPLSPCVSNSDWVVRRCKNAVCCCPLWCCALLAKAARVGCGALIELGAARRGSQEDRIGRHESGSTPQLLAGLHVKFCLHPHSPTTGWSVRSSSTLRESSTWASLAQCPTVASQTRASSSYQILE